MTALLRAPHDLCVKMRRLSGVFAIVALVRFSLGGVIGTCPSAPAPPHPHSAVAMSVDPPHNHDGTSCETGRGSDCIGDHGGCAAMGGCANALASIRWANLPNAPTSQRASFSLVDRLLDPTRAPEPPPPRV